MGVGSARCPRRLASRRRRGQRGQPALLVTQRRAGRPSVRDEAGVVVTGREAGLVDKPAQEAGIGLEPANQRLVQGAPESMDRRRPVVGVDHQLGEERVVFGAEIGVRLDAGVDANAGSGRHLPCADSTGGRTEAVVGILGIDADLDRVATSRRIEHLRRKPLPRRDPDLPRDEVEPRDELGDAVLDLEARVHLEEVVAAVLRDEELDGGRVVEVDGARDPTRRVEQRAARRIVDRG